MAVVQQIHLKKILQSLLIILSTSTIPHGMGKNSPGLKRVPRQAPSGNGIVDHLELLPEGYDKRQHPPRIDGKPNEISVTMDIYSIPQFDEKHEEIMLEVRLSHYWLDSRLKNNFTEPLELVPEAIKDFWTPDSYFHHAKKAEAVSLITEPASLRITPDKVIKYTMMTMVTVGCPMAYHFYPMDQQTCRLELQSFGYSMEYNNYTWKRPPFLKRDTRLDNFNVGIEQYPFSYTSDGLRYPGLGLRIELRRYLVYHIIQTYIPSVIYVTVAWVSFMVPSDVIPGRMVLCVTTLLTLTSMFNAVRSLTPQVSYMKAIDLWVFVCICFVFSSLAEYGIVLHLTSRAAWQRKVDQHVKNQSGKSKLSKLGPFGLLATVAGQKKDIEANMNLNPDFVRGVSETLRANGRLRATAPSVTSPEPRSKEKLAYTIEYSVKFLYPLVFIIFNIAYWTYYLKDYKVKPVV